MNSMENTDNPGRVLIVDDSPVNVSLLESILVPHGFLTSSAACATDAFTCLENATADLILLDVMMPDMDGYQAARRIKSSHATKDIPIIFLTAKTETEDVVAGFEAGGVDYVTKPFNARELLARIGTHVALKRAREEIQTLRGILPVCAHCKKVRENHGGWISLEEFIRDHTEAELSHGMCPDCVTLLYPQIAERIRKKRLQQ
jgi:DNA-binding response OmpR family regulator